jgi:uncharacterized membrane protein (DUF4010 family)
MNTYSIEPVGKSWTVTEIVALIVAIASGLYMLPRVMIRTCGLVLGEVT